MAQSPRRNSSGAPGLGRAVYQDVAHCYVIKNLVVKPSGPLLCGVGWNSLSAAEETPTQLLVVQPGGPASSPSSSLPQSQRRTGGEASKNSYLPILNSYLRIAPHPRQESSEQERGGDGAGGVKQSGGEGQRQTKRVCTEERRETVSTSQQREGRPQHQASSSSILRLPHHSLGGPSLSTQRRPHHHRPHSPSTLRSSSMGSPSVSSSQTSSTDSPPHPASEAQAGDILSDSQSDCSSVRQRRFLNTAEILSQSGLLAITLRTKDLQRQSAATERDIAQLRQHAHLLCLAVQALGPGTGPSRMDTLLQAMDQSGCYSSMDWGQINTRQPPNRAKRGNETEREREKGGDRKDDSQAPNFVSVGYHDDRTSPPSPLFAPSPAPPVLFSCTTRAGAGDKA
ncbi:CLOCK-interacting pacemaker-like [Osmerus mordax]|uniref:CLOCK-interacting pacemaker-like n=1 Tax=Osmerus mordax TaxID=8014 RepID=UPI00350F5C9F